ncbi:thiol-disulfide oxidoreductase DCC family protein [Bacillus solimangrovi]|uniref:DUF393 domain-containing protein n=1 Tax=Bacillus solimangrovi TaxID=1305675 RepID=A0A1E5LDF7_9BACI|nr:DUF393 domain-containing protein [Bacillus solimangrovi]OEH92113.1 hypothetical protein BFG57_16650 [Bacillus solimangrovi]
MKKSTVYYDGQCEICCHTKRTLSFFDWFKIIDWIPLQEMVNDLPFSIEEASKELKVITSNNKVYGGYYAVRKLFLRLPLFVPIGLIAYIPGINRLGVPLYKWLANNRKKLLRRKCKNGQCQI